MTRKAIAIACCLLAVQMLCAQNKTKADKDWFLKSRQTAGIYGIGTDAAAALLKDIRPRKDKVVVAVIDSGTDTGHEYLQEMLWTNRGEIPGNGIDDDRNGFIDDIHGWSFIPDKQDGKGMTAPKEADKIFLSMLETRKKRPFTKEEEKLWKELKTITPLPVIHEDLMHVRKMDSLAARITRDLSRKTRPQYISNRHLRQYLISAYWKLDEEEKDMIRAMDAVLTKSNRWTDITAAIAVKLQEREKLHARLVRKAAADDRMLVGDDLDNLRDCRYGEAKVSGQYAKHGTHVAGTVARVVKETGRQAGTALPVEIMVVKTVPSGDENDKDVALAIRYAVDNGAAIINMSFGKRTGTHPEWVSKALDYAARKDVLVIHAAANDNRDLEKYAYYPGPYSRKGKLRKNMVTVGASDMDGLPASFSNYGKRTVDFFAPGVKIYAPVPGNEYAEMSGTSMASPVVAGMAAVLRSYFPDLKACEIKEAMVCSTKHSPGKEALGRQKAKPGITDYRELCRTDGIITLDECIKWLQENR